MPRRIVTAREQLDLLSPWLIEASPQQVYRGFALNSADLPTSLEELTGNHVLDHLSTWMPKMHLKGETPGLGSYWTSRRSLADEATHRSGNDLRVILTAEVGDGSIDHAETARANSHFKNENEVNIGKGNPIRVVGVDITPVGRNPQWRSLSLDSSERTASPIADFLKWMRPHYEPQPWEETPSGGWSHPSGFQIHPAPEGGYQLWSPHVGKSDDLVKIEDSQEDPQTLKDFVEYSLGGPKPTHHMVHASWEDEALDEVKNHGGFTFRDHPGDGPHSGYMVSLTPKQTDKDMGEVTPQFLKDFYEDEENKKLLDSDEENFKGGWLNNKDNHLYLDVPHHDERLWDAVDDALDNAQLAIYDIGNDYELDTEDDGYNPLLSTNPVLISAAKNPHEIMGVNINDKYQDFTGQILRGEKTIETRDSHSLHPYVGRRIGLVSTGRGPATLVGYATVGEPIRYDTREDFDADYDRHLVEPGSQFDFKEGVGKFGYPFLDVEPTEPWVLPKANKGNTSRSLDREAASDSKQLPLPGMSKYKEKKPRKGITVYRGLGLDLNNPGMEKMWSLIHPYLKSPTPYRFTDAEGNYGIQQNIFDEIDPPGMPENLTDSEKDMRRSYWDGSSGNYGHPALGEMLLDYLENDYSSHHPYAPYLGRHWTTDPNVAWQFSLGEGGGLRAILKAELPYGTKTDPRKTNVNGYFPHEKEKTLTPGTPIDVHDIQIYDRNSGDWRSVPVGDKKRTAAFRLAAPPATLSPTGYSPGGGHGVKVWNDETGSGWLAKPGSWSVPLDVATSQLQQLAGLSTPETYSSDLTGKPSSIQRMVPNATPAFRGSFRPDKMSPEDRLVAQKHHVLDWLIANHDSHPGQFIRNPETGEMIGIDKGQAFKHFGSDVLDWDFHPNSYYGEQEPIYNTMWRDFAEGRGEMFDPSQGELGSFIQKIQSIPDDNLKEMFRPYAQATAQEGKLALQGYQPGLKEQTLPANDVEAFLNALAARKNNLGKDFQGLYNRAMSQRGRKMVAAVDTTIDDIINLLGGPWPEHNKEDEIPKAHEDNMKNEELFIRSLYENYPPDHPNLPEELKPHLMIPTDIADYYKEHDRPYDDRMKMLEGIIRDQGIRSPVQISTDGTHALLTEGNHRLQVAKKLGIKELPARVFLEKPGEVMKSEEYSKPIPLEKLLGSWVSQNAHKLKSYWS